MGIKLLTKEYINFKEIRKQRQNKPIEFDEEGKFNDVLYCKVWLNIFPDETKSCDPLKVTTFIEIPYKKDLSDNEVYDELKKQIIFIKDIYGRDIRLDLTKSEDC